jgi:DNA-binding response OmpR family regulator
MSKLLALVIEDHEDHTIIFNNAFKMAGFETEVVTDGAVAQQRLSELIPAVVVLDLHLPNVSGEALLHQVRADERLADTKVIVVTADESLADKLIEGADLVLIKPVSFSHLRDLAQRFRASIDSSADVSD